MKIICIIPARFKSSRFEGKPLADICGKPMIWWVYNQALKVSRINEVIVATDDERIVNVCNDFNIKAVLTSKNCGTSTERVYEVAQKNPADIYVVINGDEPLIKPETINAVIPNNVPLESIFVCNLYTKIKTAAGVVDFTNIKVVFDSSNNALFMSRSPIPYPKSSLNYDYYKHVGVLSYNFAALEFFTKTKKGYNELIEDINELRFIENGIKLKMIEVDGDTLSVDTPKDLEFVINTLNRDGEKNV